MRHRIPRRLPAGVLVFGALVMGCLAACSGPAFSTDHSSSTSQQITANWEKFFSGTTPASEKIKLLQNGSKFTAIIDGQSSSGLAKATTAKVLSVRTTSKTAAKVVYTIYLSGQPALKNQDGVAIRSGGTWLVGDSSFCGLLGLEGTKSSACPKS